MTHDGDYPDSRNHPDDSRHPDDRQHQHPDRSGLAGLLDGVTGPEGRFGHRQHVHLTYLAVRRYGTADATRRMSDLLRQLTERAGVPGKFHVTMTMAWTELVGWHAAAVPAGEDDFAGFAERFPQLLDSGLLARHYSRVVLDSPAARAGWAEPDLAPFPWRSGADG